jgi:hypothetical protein
MLGRKGGESTADELHALKGDLDERRGRERVGRAGRQAGRPALAGRATQISFPADRRPAECDRMLVNPGAASQISRPKQPNSRSRSM